MAALIKIDSDVAAVFDRVGYPPPRLRPAGFGTLGCALPDAIGAKLAVAEKIVIALVGDGGFMFTVNELATAVEEKLSIPVIIWHNHSYAMIRDGMLKRGIAEIGVNPVAPDFVKLAEAFG